jgi:4-alpha-glucanotransferase
VSSLHDLARAAGLDPDYLAFNGAGAAPSDDALRAALAAIGPFAGFDDRTDHATAIATIARTRWAERVAPVVVAWDGALEIPFAVPAERDGTWHVEITTETGRRITASGLLYELPAADHAWPDNVVHCLRRASVSLDGELGYHAMRWTVLGATGESMIIAAPMRGFGGPGSGRRRWGVFAPVYGLATVDSGAAGDLASLRRLFAQVEQRGGSYVATLPLLAAFLDEPCQISPYSPASRLAWNELYLDLAQLAAEAGISQPIAPAISGALIDFRAQYAWRREVIDACAARLLADPARAAAIDAWADGGIAYDYAAFRAIGETQRASWQHWPARLRDRAPVIRSRADAAAAGIDLDRLGSHVVAQWAMQRQLGSLGGGRARLYLDLPVGVNRDAYEVWRHRQLFLLSLSAGAPPDALFLGGQDWGLPPLAPQALRKDHYRYFIACVRHHMKVAGMLRIDHVMGLFRLYCVPVGFPATDGVYLRYHADELLAVLVLESARARCAIAGEDLGTVPDHVRPAMARHGMYRLHVGQWALPAKLGAPTLPAPPDSVASLNTHDTATFAGWWLGADIDDRRDLGLTTDQQQAAERAERAEARSAILATIPGASARAPSPSLASDLEQAMISTTAELAAGPAEILLVALDDLALEPTPHNVPGTTAQRPNWQRRVPGWSTALDPTTAAPTAANAIAAVITARRA